MEYLSSFDLEIRKKLKGCNTIQASRLIAQDFQCRFGGTNKHYEDLLRRLAPRNRATTWEDLCYNLSLFGKLFPLGPNLGVMLDSKSGQWSDFSEDNYSVLDYLDRVILAIESLPKNKDYWITDNMISKLTPKKIYRGFVECQLCWRSTPKNPFSKRMAYCSNHRLKSTNRDYRKRKRLLGRVYKIRHVLRNTIATPAWIRQNSKINQNDFYAQLCTDKNGDLPNLAGYLHSLNLPLDSHEDILRALEYPEYIAVDSELVAEAWELYFADRGNYFWLSYMKLLSAEAWLKAAAESKHGGKRVPRSAL